MKKGNQTDVVVKRLPGGEHGEPYDEFGGEIGKANDDIKDDYEAAEALRIISRARELRRNKQLMNRARDYADYQKERAEREKRLLEEDI